MRTTHALHVGDAADTSLADQSVDLVVTSPPYPMIEMWDDLFSARDDTVADALDEGDGEAAFEAMHAQLDAVWDEVARVLRPGGIVCINVGDATRSLGGSFRQYPNHARVLSALTERGLNPLPDIIWRKPTNSRTKFMGSGTLPPNAYVTLEHEYVLILRKGLPRSFPPGDESRYESAIFWEERNQWFSDLWEFTGTAQRLESESRTRSAAFPIELPLRLIRMYSVYGDTVLDPFLGTGTTTIAAILAGRNSVGYELESSLVEAFGERLTDISARSEREVSQRLADHRRFSTNRATRPGYDADTYDFRVVTKQEQQIQLYRVASVSGDEGEQTATYTVEHTPVTSLPNSQDPMPSDNADATSDDDD
ncbi:DNA-methyltransferase [Haloferax sp. DFSO60]|uniref:DNA-methyltransferase n=1 Tax=Haloferax sp. DFSO60 TaxID=3388652 RepID=UPI00397AEE87